MTRKVKRLIAAGVLALGCLVLVGGALLGALSIPPISQQLPEQANGAMTFVFTSQ
jgi:hypothetical protein